MRRLLTLWWLLNVPCREAAQLVSESLDRELTRAERWAVQLHMLYCIACRRYRRQVFLLRSALRRPTADCCQSQEPLATTELAPEVREQIKRRLRESWAKKRTLAADERRWMQMRYRNEISD
jgi:hypothetical protein